jgi:hypothetical protein
MTVPRNGSFRPAREKKSDIISSQSVERGHADVQVEYVLMMARPANC